MFYYHWQFRSCKLLQRYWFSHICIIRYKWLMNVLINIVYNVFVLNGEKKLFKVFTLISEWRTRIAWKNGKLINHERWNYQNIKNNNNTSTNSYSLMFYTLNIWKNINIKKCTMTLATSPNTDCHCFVGKKQHRSVFIL